MFQSYAYRTEAISLDGAMLGDLASAVENLRDYLADCRDDEFPDRAVRVQSLRQLATFLRAHPDVTLEAGTEGGVGTLLSTPDEQH